MGFGPLGFGVALLAVGGVFVSQGNNIAGLICDLLGVVFIWSGLVARRRD